MKEPVIVHSEVKAKILIEGKFDYSAKLTVGLADGGDYFLLIDFINLTMEDFKILTQLSKLPRRLPIKCDFFDKQQYKITHIVVTRFTTTNNLTMRWECLSDDPSLYKSLIIE